jgi:hypothetical protein
MLRSTLVLAVSGCAAELPPLAEFHELGLFADRAHDTCAPEVVSAWGGSSGGLVGAVAADRDRLYVFRHDRDETWLTTLDVADPRAARDLGSARLPHVGYPVRAAAHGGLLLVSWHAGGERLGVIDPSDPLAPRLLDVVELGRTGAPTSFASSGDLVFTDAGGLHAVDLTEPTSAEGLSFRGLPLLGAPAAVGDLVLGTVDVGPLGEGCAAVVVDPATSPPSEQSRFATASCASVGFVGVDGGVLGVGWSAGVAQVEAMSTAPWGPGGTLAIPELRPELAVGVDGGAVVVGDGRAAFFRVREGTPARAATWWPPPAYVESAAPAAGLLWVAVSHQREAFEGVVALSFGGCP